MNRPSAEILLVEDNPSDVELMRAGIESSGIFRFEHWHVVPDGEQALAYLRRRDPFAKARRPHLVLLDLNLPGRDGREILAEIKSDREINSIPVIVLSSSDEEHDIRLSYELQADAYIRKARDLPQLIDILDQIHRFWLDRIESPP